MRSAWCGMLAVVVAACVEEPAVVPDGGPPLDLCGLGQPLGDEPLATPTVVTTIEHLGALASDGERLYALAGDRRRQETSLYWIDPAEGTPHLMATVDERQRRELVVHGDHVYFATAASVTGSYDARSVYRIPRSGGEVERLTEREPMGGWAPDGDDLYFFRMLALDEWELVRRPIGKGADEILSRRLGAPFVVDDVAVWAAGSSLEPGVLVARIDKATGEERIVARWTDVAEIVEEADWFQLSSLFQDDRYVYWIGTQSQREPGECGAWGTSNHTEVVVRVDKTTGLSAIVARLPLDYTWYRHVSTREGVHHYHTGPTAPECSEGDRDCDPLSNCCPPTTSRFRRTELATGATVTLTAGLGQYDYLTSIGDTLYFANLGTYPSEQAEKTILAVPSL